MEIEQLRRNQQRLQVQVRRMNAGGRNLEGRRARRANPSPPRQPVADRPQAYRAQPEGPPTPEPMRRRQPRPDLIAQMNEVADDMPEGERNHRREVQEHFQRLIDGVRRDRNH